MLSMTWLLRLLAILPFAVAAPTSKIAKRALLPSLDPFYQPPAGFQATAPGTVLRSRTVVSSLLGLVPSGVQTYQLLFRTTAINGSAIAGVTTVFKPVNAANDRFVSFHTAYDGSSTLCNPSYSYQLSSAQLDLITDFEFLILEAFLVSGYIVSSPDYEGPDAAFGAGRLEGVVTLDSMRAVSNFKITLGLTTSTPKIVGVGYSGGAIATGWAASLQPTYAPELQVKGWAQGGTPANLTGTALYLDNTAFSGFLLPAVDGLNTPSAYASQIGGVINSIITPYGRYLLTFARYNCIADLFVFAEQSILSTAVQSLGSRIFYQPNIAAVLKQQTMGISANETPIAPVYIYHATQDEVIPYANAATLVSAWCGYGARLNFLTYAAGGHLTTEILGFVGAYQFVQQSFAGTINYAGCTRSTTLNNTLDPLALGADLEPILVRLINTLAALGQGDSNIISNPGLLNQSIST